jgi:asparagine synthase (glutamine-hydrolysing)
VARAGRVDRAALERMAAALRHRGPDDWGIEIVGSVGLVHTRLAIVDPSPAGHEPMGHPERPLWLAYNGEAFNHAELRRRLGGVEWRGTSDAETVLHALAAWGPDAARELNGLFALAFLDGDRHRVHLIRDRFGVKPLYVADRPDGIWFASEISALLAAGVPREVDRKTLLHGVRNGWANGAATPIAGIERLPPGHLMSIDTRTLSRDLSAWYAPRQSVDADVATELAALTEAQRLEKVEQALRTAVERRLMSDVPLGTMCSGGLDSSLTTFFAAEAQPGMLVFNASVTDQPDVDEGPWAELVADHLGVELRTVKLTAARWRGDLVDIVRHIEYPVNHESSVPNWQIANLARASGVKVLLSGEGADEVFGGYPWAAPNLRRDFAESRPVRGLRLRRAWHRLRALGVRRHPVLPGAQSGIATGFERSVEVEALDAYGHHRGSRRRLEAHLLGLLSTYLPHLLNRLDKATMKGSIEMREPFLDPDLVRLAVNMPLESRVLPARKELLRKLGRRYLPPRLADRPKIGFTFDLNGYLVDAARPEFLADGSLRQVQGIARDRWEALLARPGLWQLPLWTGEIWCRAFLEGESTAAITAELWKPGTELEPTRV